MQLWFLTPVALAMVLVKDPGGAFEAAVSPEHGGELASLKVRFGGSWIETLYRASDYSPTDGWTGRAPWLWPATGRNEPLPAHGFARDHAWRVERSEGSHAALSFSDTAATRRIYPHGFRLLAEYIAEGKGTLLIRFTVTAAKDNKAPMPFSAGNHITFRTPLVPGSDPLAMTIATPSSVEYLKKDRIPTGESRPRRFADPVRLGEIERLEAVSLGGYEGDPWVILRDPAGLALRMWQHATEVPGEPVVRFNLWGDPAGGYFSPEPWVGLQNAHNSRKGLTWLAPGARWTWEIRISALP